MVYGVVAFKTSKVKSSFGMIIDKDGFVGASTSLSSDDIKRIQSRHQKEMCLVSSSSNSREETKFSRLLYQPDTWGSLYHDSHATSCFTRKIRCPSFRQMHDRLSTN